MTTALRSRSPLDSATTRLDDFPKAQEKHLLHLLVEKVLKEDRCTFKVWYPLPQFPGGVRTLSLLVAPTSQYANHTQTLRSDQFSHIVFRLEAPSLAEEQLAPVIVTGANSQDHVDHSGYLSITSFWTSVPRLVSSRAK